MGKRRIMLVEIDPLVPGAKTFATLAPGDTAAGITLSEGNLRATAQPTQFGLSRATVALVSGQWYWETTYVVLPTTGYVMAAGLASPASTLPSMQLGFDGPPPLTIGGPRHNDGTCYVQGTLTGTVGAVSAGQVIGHAYDADSGTYRVRRANGAWQTLFRRPALAPTAWRPTVQPTRNGSIRCNFGASAFAGQVPDGFNAGVYSRAAPTRITVNLGTDFVIGSFKGNLTVYEGRVARNPDLVTSRQVSCWVWGGQSRSSRGQLSIVISDSAHAEWRGWTWRDAPVRIYRGYEGDARSAYTLRSVDHVDSFKRDGSRFVLTLADPIATLDVALPRPAYPADAANATAAGRVCPIVFGRPLFCEGRLRSTSALGNDAFAYDLSDSVVRIDAVYDKGDIFDAPLDWTYTQDGRGFKLPLKPDGLVVANPAGPWKVSTTVTTISAANGGDFTSWSAGVPVGWTQLGTAWTATNRFVSALPGARLQATGAQTVAMYHSSSSLASGSYVLEMNVTAVPTPGIVCFRLGANDVRVRIDRVGVCRVVLTSPSTQQLQWIAGNDGNALGAIDATFTALRVRPATLIERLPDLLPNLVSRVGALDLDTAAIAALDTAAPYRLAHYSDRDETVLSILRRMLDSFCGWVTTRSDGVLTVGRIARPSSSAALVLTNSQIKSLRLESDAARGLTTRLSGARNHRVHSEGDIAGAVPAALKQQLLAEYTITRSAQPSTPSLGRIAGVDRDIVARAATQADGAPPQATMLQDVDDIQAEAGRAPTLWRDTAGEFATVECVLPSIVSSALEAGQTVRITWAPEGLVDVPFILLDITTREASQVVSLKLKGWVGA